MYDSFGFEFPEHIPDKAIVRERAATKGKADSMVLAEGLESLGHPSNGCCRLGAHFRDPVPPEVIVTARCFMAPLDQILSETPA
jgi:hypothetical protein